MKEPSAMSKLKPLLPTLPKSKGSVLQITGLSRKRGGKHINVKCQCGTKLSLLPEQLRTLRSCGCVTRRWLKRAKPLPVADRVLSIDPGTSNFFAAVLQDGRLRGTYQVRSPVKEIKAKTQDRTVTEFCAEMSDLLRVFQPKVIIIERFMARRFSAKIIELVGFMIGILTSMAHGKGIPIIIVPSSKWKTALSRDGAIDLQAVYQRAEGRNHPPHAVDAALMGYFAMNRLKFDSSVKNWVTSNIQMCGREIQ